MRIVVLGATGSTGQAVVEGLSEAGHTVLSVTRDVQSSSSKV